MSLVAALHRLVKKIPDLFSKPLLRRRPGLSVSSYRIVPFRPCLELLEDRVVPTGTFVGTPSVSAIVTIEGQDYSSTIGSFNVDPSFTGGSSLTATISWGDGSGSTGTIQSNGSNSFNVLGDHVFTSYTSAGSVEILVNDPTTGDSTFGSASLSVADVPSSLSVSSISAIEGQDYSGTIATFTDDNPSATAANFTATINWGDGSSSTGTVISYEDGADFGVVNDHTYNSFTDSDTVSVTISNSHGSASGTNSVSVADVPLNLSVSSIQATEGQDYSGTIATFTEDNPSAPSGLTATINWGDGSTSSGTIESNGSGGFNVVSDHTYSGYTDSGTVSVTVENTNGSISDSTSLSVADVASNVSVSAIDVTEGQDYSGTIATFTDDNPSATSGSFSATINWGDGSTSAGTIVADGSGNFSVLSDHTYSGYTDSGTVSVTVENANGSNSGSASLSVADVPLNLSVSSIQATEGQSYAGTIATFTDDNPSATSGSFTATINWGDGSTSAGTVAADGSGNFSVLSDHTYSGYTDSGTISVTVANANGTISDSTSLSVADVASNVSVSAIDVTEGQDYSGTIATFTDDNPSATSGSFAATINWGDGSTSAGTIAADGSGNFSVLSDHTYSGYTDSGTVSVTVANANGSSSGSATLSVADVPSNLSVFSVQATEGQDYSGPIATFTDDNPSATSGSFSATINWGDGTTSTGSVESSGSGNFTVLGDHTYDSDPSASDISVTVSNENGSTSGSADLAVVVPVQFDSSTYYTYGVSGGEATITVDLPIAWNDDVTVHYATSDGTGVAGTNYDSASGTLTIPAGDTSGTFTVPLLDNNGLGSSPATVNLTLSSPSSDATLGTPSTAVLYIYGLSWVGGPVFSWSQTTVSAPSITLTGGQTNVEGDSVSLAISASDPNSYALTYDAVNLPLGLSIDASSGVISGTVSAESAENFGGDYAPTLIVADDHGASTYVSFAWTVTLAPPSLTNPGDQTSTSGAAVSLQISASQLDSDPLEYAASGLPSGLSIDPDSGLITGTLDSTSISSTPYSVTVSATDDTPDTPTSTSQTFNWTIGAGTPSPALDSPGDQTNAVGDDVDLVLSGSDGGGYPLTFLASGLPAGLSMDPGSGEIIGTLTNADASATPYSVTVLTSDGQASASETFSWTVGGVTLDNPGDQTSLDGATIALALTATDAASGTLTYSATGLPTDLSIDSSTGVIGGTLGSAAHSSTLYAVTVTATDGTASASQTFNWEIDRLALDNPGDQRGHDGSSVSLALVFTDSINTPSFSATGLPSGLSINATTGAITGTIGTAAHVQSPDQVIVTATDGTLTSSQTFVWTVTPVVALVNPGTQGDAAGDAVTLDVTAVDLASYTLTYSETGLPSGLSINSGTGVISGTIGSGAASSTPYVVTVTAADSTYSSSQTFSWNVVTLYLAAPGDQDNQDDDTVSLSAAAAYHGTGTLVYSATGLPTGLTISASTGLISGSVGNTADVSGPFAVTVTVTDGTVTTSQALTWYVDARVALDAFADAASVPGDVVSLDASGIDYASGTPTITYSASGLPTGLSIDSASGLISGTITASVSGTPYAVTVTAADGTASASQSFNWYLLPLLLANPGDQASVGGATVSLSLTADVASGVTASYGASGLPTGLSINSSTGVISGTLSSGDTGNAYAVTVTATGSSLTLSQQFLWRVNTVVLTNPGDQTGTEGDAVTLAVTARAVSGTLTYTADGLPAGLSIDSSSGVISGTIAAGTAVTGDFTVTVFASNGSVADGQTFDWTVNPLVVVAALDDQSNVEGGTVSLGVTASEAGVTLSYSATGLPGGLSINSSTGAITGTVATGAAAAGPYDVIVTVSDGTYNTAAEFGWAITHGSNHAPVVTNPGTQANTIGDSESLTLSASDADSDTLQYSADGLPDGLSIDPASGIISGVLADDAVQSTPYSVTVTADDGNGGTTPQTFDWIVNDSTWTLSVAGMSATEGSDMGSLTVATLTDPDVNRDPSEFTATINWGDGSSDVGYVEGTNGSFTVSGDHVYDHPGSYTIQVSVTDNFVTVASSGMATVSEAALTETGDVAEGEVAGSAVTATWASFVDANPNDAASSYTATIDWGDSSTPTTGTVIGSDGTFIVSGGHSYTFNGTYTVTVTVTDQDGTESSATSTAQVGDVVAGEKATLTVASFASSNPGATASDFTATVDWGDGSTLDTDVTISASGGGYTIQGSHLYTVDSIDQPGETYTVTVTINGPDVEVLGTTTAVKVVRPPMTGVGDEIVAAPTVAFSNVEVATFTEPDVTDGSSEFTATIYWGDGTSSDGTVTGSSGMFHVLGGHTYATAGNYSVEVDVTQAWNFSLLGLSMLLLAEVPAAPAAPYEVNTDNPAPNGVSFVNGPTVSVISWIQESKDAGKLMNWVANTEPPSLFEPAKSAPGQPPPKQWGNFLESKQFRDSLFAKVTVYGGGKNGLITAYHISATQNVGYTPTIGGFIQGKGNISYKVTVKTPKQVSVEVTARFIVNPVENVGQALLNARGPLPFAWVGLTYTMSVGKNGEILTTLSDLKGSLVPSQYFYLKGKLVAKYNMDNKNSAANITAFNNALSMDDKPLKSFDAPGVTYTSNIPGFTNLSN